MSASTYAWSGFTLPDDLDPLGVWVLVPQTASAPGTASAPQTGETPQTRREAFGAETRSAAPHGEEIVWRVSHPTASKESRRAARDQLAAVDRQLKAMDRVAYHLSVLSPVASYGRSVLPRQDSELLAEVAALTAPATPFSGEVQQGTPYRQLLAQAGHIESASQLLSQLRQLVAHWARVETRVHEVLIAVTTVDWTGDYEKAWSNGLSPAEMALHLDDVRLALASRRALLRLISVVTTGALDLALKASIPGGQILLIPAVYKYVRDVLAELEQMPEGVLTG